MNFPFFNEIECFACNSSRTKLLANNAFKNLGTKIHVSKGFSYFNVEKTPSFFFEVLHRILKGLDY